MHGTHVELSISACIDGKGTSHNNHWWQYSIKLQKEINSNPKTAQLQKNLVCGPQEGHCEKRCEIQGVCQEMAVMVG